MDGSESFGVMRTYIMSNMEETNKYPDDLFVSGHRACHGCGLALGVRHVLKATGNNVVVVAPTGCLETFSLTYGYSAWRVPFIHHLFENGPSIATGVIAALKSQGREDIRVLALAGDGATFDIGFGALSGMLERGEDVLYICFDNEAYMNTGGQRSGATPMYASTTTQPAGTVTKGKVAEKKDLPAIVASHGVEYVATASVAYLKDLQKKVKKAMTYHGSRYIQVDTPCPSVWGFPSDMTLEIARLGVQSGLIPIFEMEHGKITNVRKIKKKIPVMDFLKTQKRFKHLTDKNKAKDELFQIQSKADLNINKFGLM